MLNLALLQSIFGEHGDWARYPWQERWLNRAALGCLLVSSYFVKVHVPLTLPALSFLDCE